MSEDEIICENCGENTNALIFECDDCGNPLCDVCSNICKNCGSYYCDGCYHDHKKGCK